MVLLSSAVSAPTFAHGLNLSVTAYEQAVAGRASFADGSPIAEVPVELHAAERSLARSRTDTEGRFAFPAPPAPGVYRIIVDDGLGHRAAVRIEIGDGTGMGADADADTDTDTDPDPAPASAMIEETPHTHSHWQQWVSGLGYLLGLFGMGAWWLARRDGTRTRS